MAILNKCCCGCSLTLAGLIIGWMDLIIHMIFVFAGTLFSNDFVFHFYSNFMFPWMGRYNAERYSATSQILPIRTNSLMITFIFIKIIIFTSSITLLIGTTKKKRYLLLPYLGTQSFKIGLLLFGWLFKLVDVFIHCSIQTFEHFLLWTFTVGKCVL